MSEIRNFLKNFFSPPTPNAPTTSPQTPPAPDSSTLYLLLLAERQSGENNYYLHQYEVIFWQSGPAFNVEMRSAVGYRWRGDSAFTRYYGWSYQLTVNNLAAGQALVTEILNAPERVGDINKPSQVSHYYWDGKLHGQPKVLFIYERSVGLADGSLAEQVATGGKALGQGLEAGEIVRQLWGRTEKASRTAIRQFASTAHFTYGSWSHWKWLYKQAGAAHDYELLSIMMTRLDLAELTRDPNSRYNPTSWRETKPGQDTLAYMKRRARRYLRELAERDPAKYVELASSILLQAGRGLTTLNLRDQWVSLDSLYGGSNRYQQSGHSRGAYKQHGRLSFAKIDERAPAAWTNRPDLINQLYTEANLPWQIQEWAAYMLKRRELAWPMVGGATLSRFLNGGSTLLVRVAVAQVVGQMAAGQTVEAAPVAQAFFLANASQRRQLTELLQKRAADREWDALMALSLSKHLARPTTTGRITPRRTDSAILLANRYADLVDAKALFEVVPLLLATKRREFLPLVEKVIAGLPAELLPDFLGWCSVLDEEQKRYVVEILLADKNRKITPGTASRLIAHSIQWVREVGWQVLAQSSNAEAGGLLWEYIVSAGEPIWATALTSPAALGLLWAAPEKSQQVWMDKLVRNPHLLDYVSRSAFATLVKRVPIGSVAQLVAAMNDTAWLTLRERTLDELRADGRLASFWQAVWNSGDDRLHQRTLGDPAVGATFAEIGDDSFLATSNAIFAPLLLDWMNRRLELFEKGSKTLLAAAMHKLPGVREWALNRARSVGLTLPFALRLLESGLPESIALGREFFEAVPPGDERELEYALVICDSPDRTVQALGRDFIEKRKATLPAAELLRRLAEHPDPPMQAVVAQSLLETPELASSVPEFDKNVLRARDKGRKVKELVKTRLANTVPTATTLDKTALLEMARSQTPRDAEWAWQQLARLAIAGEDIAGLELSDRERGI